MDRIYLGLLFLGYGFSLDRSDARKTFKTVLPGVDFDRVKAGTASITKEDARKLFNVSVVIFLSR